MEPSNGPATRQHNKEPSSPTTAKWHSCSEGLGGSRGAQQDWSPSGAVTRQCSWTPARGLPRGAESLEVRLCMRWWGWEPCVQSSWQQGEVGWKAGSEAMTGGSQVGGRDKWQGGAPAMTFPGPAKSLIRDQSGPECAGPERSNLQIHVLRNSYCTSAGSIWRSRLAWGRFVTQLATNKMFLQISPFI